MTLSPGSSELFNPDGRPLGRRWLRLAVCLVLLIVAAGVIVAGRFLAAPKYTATALIRVATSPPAILSASDTSSPFDLYKSTQIQLLTSDFVLNAALRQLGALEIVKQQGDPIRWLASTLEVETARESEIIRVSCADERKDVAVAIVNAVVNAYMKEVVEHERYPHKERIVQLNQLFNEKEAQLHSRLTEWKRLVEQSGADGQQANPPPQAAVLTQLITESRRAQLQAELQLSRANFKLKGKADGSAELIAAKAEAELAEADRDFWIHKSAMLSEELEKLESRLGSADEAMMRVEIESLQAIMKTLNDKRQKEMIELDARPRIELVQRAF
jgi:uncharacterized protein involved in exopolysaccharide biosynthesis